MKKALALLLVCLLALTAALTGVAEEASLTGVWTLTQLQSQGVTIDPAIAGLEMAITLNEDGSAIIEMTGVGSEAGTWTTDGETVSVTDASGAAMPFTIGEDGTLSIEQDGAALILTRGAADASAAGAAASPAGADASFAGTWTLTQMQTEGITADPTALGMEIVIVLYEDGSAQMGMSGVTEDGTWSVENGIVSVVDAVGTPMELTPAEDGSLQGDMDGVGVVFTYTGEPAPISAEIEAPENALGDVTLADFEGDWTATHGVAMGMEVSMESLGMQMDVSIENGNVSIYTDGAGGAVPATLEGNALVIDQAGITLPLFLCDDGTLSMTMNIGMTVEIIFERAA